MDRREPRRFILYAEAQIEPTTQAPVWTGMAADRPPGGGAAEGLAESSRAGRDIFLLQNIWPVSRWGHAHSR